jgi:glycosyltransferase involved in cell wall biosynthesis
LVVNGLSPSGSRLRILHIASGDRWGGAEAQLFTLLSQLQRDAALEVRAVLLNDGELAARLRERGLTVTVFDENRLGGLAVLRHLRQLMRAWRPQIVHTHRQKENVLGAIANRFSVRAPSVRTTHGAPEHPPQGIRQLHKRLFHRLDDWCGRHWQDRVIAVSQDLAGQLRERFPAAHIATIENGVDIEAVQAAIAPVDFRQREPDALHIGLVGRLDPVKRVDLFLAMAALLLKEQPQRRWRFHIFGDGKLRPALEAQAQALGVVPATIFHGHRTDIVPCLAGLDALVMCSDHEGLPMTVLESIVAGTPVVAHAVGGITNVLANETGGSLVHDHSPPGYAGALLALLHNPQLADSLAAGKTRARSGFSAPLNAEKTTTLYADLLRRR